MQTEPDNDTIEGMLALVKGFDASHNPHFAYIAIPFENYEAFLNAQAQGNYDLSAFGIILYHGQGAEPSAAIQKEMEAKYGALHDFEHRIYELINAQPQE